MGMDESVQNIAGALKPSNQEPSARWRWGTVESVTEHGTMNVNVGGTSLMGIRAMQHVMGAQVGDRVRVAYYGTDAVVDAIRATDGTPHIDAQEWLDALGFEFGTYSGTVNVTSSWYGVYYGTVTIPITAHADTSYDVQATVTCSGNLVWCSVNSKGTSSFELFVISPRNSAQSVEIDWMVFG